MEREPNDQKIRKGGIYTALDYEMSQVTFTFCFWLVFTLEMPKRDKYTAALLIFRQLFLFRKAQSFKNVLRSIF